ncbi:MAG: calcium/sodium antiporter [Candidatus Heimdallarchaeota archaeon]|nr:calcium/sodium antiporter [Candidatus Nomurabacteria bacterium]MDH5646365.1 calcium/sodium antiporter [Candidatus Heimdallarchaeota archaeon]
MQIFIWTVVFVASLALLIKAADYFTKYSEKIGLLFGMSSFVIGATIVAIGTSLPELISSLYAVVEAGTTEFVADNIIGSNIANALLILGISALVARTLKIKTSLIDTQLPFFFMSMAVFVLFAWDGSITPVEGIFLLGMFVIFVLYMLRSGSPQEDKEELKQLKEQFNGDKKSKQKYINILKYSGVILISMVGIFFGAKYFIDSLLALSELVGITSSILTLTVVAIGTSLPEVITSVVAVRHGNHGMAIGNVLGSNTFNLLLVGGLPALFGTLTISNATMAIGLPFLVVATFATIFAIFDNKIRLWEGVALLFLYIVFLAQIVGVI